MGLNIDPIYGAPLLVVVSPQAPTSSGVDYLNSGTVLENMMLSAADLGIGSCVIWEAALAIEADKELKEICGITEVFSPRCSIAIGYPLEPIEEKPLKNKIRINYI